MINKNLLGNFSKVSNENLTKFLNEKRKNSHNDLELDSPNSRISKVIMVTDNNKFREEVFLKFNIDNIDFEFDHEGEGNKLKKEARNLNSLYFLRKILGNEVSNLL